MSSVSVAQQRSALSRSQIDLVVEHDTVDDTLRVHAPARTDIERVREVVRAAAVALGII
jgi:hypothetical protein